MHPGKLWQFLALILPDLLQEKNLLQLHLGAGKTKALLMAELLCQCCQVQDVWRTGKAQLTLNLHEVV